MVILAAHAWLQQQRRCGCLGVWWCVAHQSTWGNAGNIGGGLSVMVVTEQCCLLTFHSWVHTVTTRLYLGLIRKLFALHELFIASSGGGGRSGGEIQTYHKSHPSVLDFSSGVGNCVSVLHPFELRCIISRSVCHGARWKIPSDFCPLIFSL